MKRKLSKGVDYWRISRGEHAEWRLPGNDDCPEKKKKTFNEITSGCGFRQGSLQSRSRLSQRKIELRGSGERKKPGPRIIINNRKLNYIITGYSETIIKLEVPKLPEVFRNFFFYEEN